MAIATGELFPQTQTATGGYSRNAVSGQTANGQFTPTRFFDQWNYAFNLNWEIDFWGRLRRAIESQSATLDASVEDYDDTLVTLLGDVATNYVQLRALQKRIEYAKSNAELQRQTLTIIEARAKGGTTPELDMYQARSTLESTEAEVPEFQIQLRQTNNQLCILLGIPPEELETILGPGPIPAAPPEVAIGIPADLLRRRPDVRRTERQAAAQSAQIGIAEAQFYPAISVNGTLGASAQNFSHLFDPTAFQGNIGPSFQWNVLNYGRILNNVRYQDARFQELVATYQQAVLTASQDAENGIVTFLRGTERTRFLAASVSDAEMAVKIVIAQFKAGQVDLTRVTQLEETLVQQQDLLAQAQQEIGTGLIQVFRAVGGGWQIRLTDGSPGRLPPPTEPGKSPETIATPKPAPESPKPMPEFPKP